MTRRIPRVTGREGPPLRGRLREQETLDGLLREVHAGRSQVFVVRGEPGAGKTVLLGYLRSREQLVRVVHLAGVQPESEIEYSGLYHLCAPLLYHLERMPEPQRAPLARAFGLSHGGPPGVLAAGRAVLGLLVEAASREPLIWVVDDVQWLDQISVGVLGVVARRLRAGRVALVFAVSGLGNEHILSGLPELLLEGLPDHDARALLDSVLTGPVDAQVRDRIVAEARGNPRALLQCLREMSPTELTFGFTPRQP